eukprot:2291306-Alexandrium_andersonii.AAC.1
MEEYIKATWVWSKCLFALCPCPHNSPRYESGVHMVSPYFFPFETWLGEMFEGVGLVCTKRLPAQRSAPVAMP